MGKRCYVSFLLPIHISGPRCYISLWNTYFNRIDFQVQRAGAVVFNRKLLIVNEKHVQHMQQHVIQISEVGTSDIPLFR